MKPLTQNHIVEIWQRDLTYDEKRGMALMASALSLASRKEPVVFKCTDGTLIKVEKYDPDVFSQVNVALKMGDPFVVAAINQAYENGYRVGHAH